MRKRANGEGTIYQRQDGRWVATVSLDDGTRKSYYRHSQAEAVIALQLANQAKLEGTLTSTRKETVEEFLLEWLEYCIKPDVRQLTYLRYENLLIRHVFPTLGDVCLQRLTPKHLQKLYREKQQQGYSPQTIQQIHKLLSRALADAQQWNHVVRNVCLRVKVPRVPRRETSRALTVQQARQLLAFAQGDPLEALYVLALTTGMREGELLGLQWADIDWKSGKVQVRRALSELPKKGLVLSELKTPSSRRCILLTELACVALQQHGLRQQEARREAGSDWVEQDLIFCNAQGKPLQRSNLLERSFHPLLCKAGLPHIRFHDLRHTAATLLLLLDVHPKVVQELLGHSQILVTLDTYSHVLPPLHEDAMQRLQVLLTAPFFPR